MSLLRDSLGPDWVLDSATQLDSIGLHGAALQMSAVVWLLDSRFAGAAPERDQWVEALGQAGSVPSDRLLDWAAGHWEMVPQLDLSRDFAWLMHATHGEKAYSGAKSRLTAAGLGPSWTELADLSHDFALVRLPRAVAAFDPRKGAGKEPAWLQTVFARYAQRALIGDRNFRAHLELLESVDAAAPLPAQPGADLDLAKLDIAIAALPVGSRRALVHYFGLQGPEQSIGQVGRILDVSEFLARAALLEALARLVLALDVRAGWNSDELEFMRLCYQEGMDPRSAAAFLGLKQHEGKGLAQSVASRLRAMLRSRTIGAGAVGEKAMSGKSKNNVSLAQIVAYLRQNPDTPTLRRDAAGKAEAQLGEQWLPVELLRRDILNAGEAEELEKDGVYLGWLLVPDRPLWTPAAESLAETPEPHGWSTAETLWSFCLAADPGLAVSFMRDEPSEDEGEDSPALRIYRTLTALSHAVRSRVPVAGLDRHTFDCRRADGKLIGQWTHSGDRTVYPLIEMLERRAASVGRISAPVLQLLSSSFDQEFLYGELCLPGFSLKANTAIGECVRMLPLSSVAARLSETLADTSADPYAASHSPFPVAALERPLAKLKIRTAATASES